MKKRAMMLLALAAAMGMMFGTAAFAEEAKTETKTITVDGEELTVEVTDIGKQVSAMASCCPRSQEEPLQIWSSLTTGFLLISMRQRDVLHHWMTH